MTRQTGPDQGGIGILGMGKEWGSALVVYLWQMCHRGLGVAITFVGLVLALLTDIRGHAIGLSVEGWGLVALGGVVIAGFLEWRTLHHHPEHVDKIRRLAVSVHDSLSNGRSRALIQYSDGDRSDEVLKDMFQGHCPKGIASLLDEWDRIGTDIPNIEATNLSRMQTQVAEEIRSSY